MSDEIGSKMVTDDERRRVAERLRRLNAPSLIALMSILDVGGRDMCARLADLIEPCNMSHGCRDTVACDRDALLALAGEMDKWALTCDHYDRQVSPLDVTRYAHCIRKACGVVG